MGEEKVMQEQMEEKLVETLIELANRHKLTIYNIQNITSKACDYLKKNATL